MSNSTSDNRYDEGYKAGFADGFRAYQEQNSQVRPNRPSQPLKTTRLSKDFPNPRLRSPDRPIGSQIKTTTTMRKSFEESNPYQDRTRGSRDQPNVYSSIKTQKPFSQRENRSSPLEEHEMEGKDTSTDAKVEITARGRY